MKLIVKSLEIATERITRRILDDHKPRGHRSVSARYRVLFLSSKKFPNNYKRLYSKVPQEVSFMLPFFIFRLERRIVEGLPKKRSGNW